MKLFQYLFGLSVSLNLLVGSICSAQEQEAEQTTQQGGLRRGLREVIDKSDTYDEFFGALDEDPLLVEEARALQFEQKNIITDVLDGATRPFRDAIQNARDMMDAPETFAQIKEKLNGLLDGSEQQEKFWRKAQTNMGPIMKRLDNDPELFKDIEGMVRDKTFRKNLENMFENDRFKNFIESTIGTVMEDPTSAKNINKIARMFRKVDEED